MPSAMLMQSTFEAKAFSITTAAAEQAASLAEQYSIPAVVLRDQFELFALKNQYDSFEVTEDMLTKFAAWLPKVASTLKAQSSGASRLKHSSTASGTPKGAARTPLVTRSTNAVAGTSTPAPRTAAMATPNTAALASAQKGQVVASLNWEAGKRHETLQPGCPCRVAVVQPSALLTDRFRYFQDNLTDKVALINGRIISAEQQVEADSGMEAHPVGLSCQDTVISVGRVLCDTAGGRLNSSSLLLEGSVDTSQGEAVPLDVDALPSVRLFPGQVVAATGTNPSGHKFVASQLRSSFPPPQRMTPLSQLAGMIKDSGTSPLSIMVAAGPFLLPDSLAFEPLQALVTACQERKPSALLLLGPFVDAAHPMLAKGTLDATFQELFQAQVVDYLTEAVSQSTQVLLLPSVQDLHAPFCFPQPPLRLDPVSTDRRSPAPQLHMLCNPATFSCNEVVVGATSVDVLRHISGNEYYRGSSEHRLSALAGHLLQQGSYYPMYPPASSVPLDAALGSALAMPHLPDVLLLPSELAPFAKVVEIPQSHAEATSRVDKTESRQVSGNNATQGAAPSLPPADAEGDTLMTDAAAQSTADRTPASAGHAEERCAGSHQCMQQQPTRKVLVVNPGLVCKRGAFGTFAHVLVTPHEEAAAVAAGKAVSTNGPVPHNVASRAAVQVVKL